MTHIALSAATTKVRPAQPHEIAMLNRPVTFHLQHRQIKRLARLAQNQKTSISGLVRMMVETHPLMQKEEAADA